MYNLKGFADDIDMDYKEVLKNENDENMISVIGVIPPIDSQQTQELAISVTSNYINAVTYDIVEQ